MYLEVKNLERVKLLHEVLYKIFLSVIINYFIKCYHRLLLSKLTIRGKMIAL